MRKMLKYGGKPMLEQLTKLCGEVWKAGEVPSEWRDGIVIPIPKKGDQRECSNWRGITLLSTPGKIMATILLNRMRNAVDERLRQEQAGFRPGRSCCEQIFTLRQIIEKALMWQVPVVINFIDFRKAFDSVHRESLWKIMQSYGIPEKIIGIVKSFYDNSRCAIRCGGEVGEWFRIVTGVRQGCVLSPLIFALVVDWVMQRATGQGHTGLKWIDGDRLSDLDFADDIALLDNTWEGIKELTCRVEEEAARVGLTINPEKTKIMKVGKWRKTDEIRIADRNVDIVEDFCYLGSTLSADSRCDKEIKSRIGKANAAFGRLEKVWKSNGCSLKIKIRLYEAIVLSTLLYGAETWPMTVANGKRLEAAHHRWLRRILHISWRDKITNKSIRERTGQEKMEVNIRKRRLKWMGHVSRMGQERRAKQATIWAPEGRRGRGRPRKNWMETVREDLQVLEMTWNDAVEVASNRVEWRSCIARCAELHGMD